jgi:hypothetical protein
VSDDGAQDGRGTSPDRGEDLVCSARRCRARPQWVLRWHNPALHAPGYTKVWLACEDHRAHLQEFLEQGRGFDVHVGRLGVLDLEG